MKIKFVIAFIFISCTPQVFGQSIWPWAKTWRMSNNSGGHCNNVCTDLNGNVYETGYYNGTGMMFDSTLLLNSDPSSSTYDSYLAKYDSNGNILWVQGLLCPSDDFGVGVTTDAAGNVFLTGNFSNTITFSSSSLTSVGYSDMYLIKYDTNGNLLWAKTAGGTGHDGGGSVSTDALGNVYLAGGFNSHVVNFGNITLNHSSIISNFFLAKYDASGNVIWVRDAGTTLTCAATAVSAAPNGNVFLSGYFESSQLYIGSIILSNTGNHTAFIACYDSTGNAIWAQSPTGSTYRSHAMSVSADAQSNAFLTGDFNFSANFGSFTLTDYDSSNVTDAFVVKYAPGGNVLWANKIGGMEAETGFSVSADPSGNAYVTGGSENSSPIYLGSHTLVPTPNAVDPMFIAKYGPEGDVWCSDIIASGGDIINSVAADASGNAYVGGNFIATSPVPVIVGSDTMDLIGPQRVIFIAKYFCANQVGVNEVSKEESFFIYPNPSQGIFTLNTGITGGEIVVLNMLGEIVYRSAINAHESTINLSGRASGIYFVQVKTGKQLFTQKIIVE